MDHMGRELAHELKWVEVLWEKQENCGGNGREEMSQS